MIDLSLNENPLGSSPKAWDAIHKAHVELNRYPDPTCSHLRHALGAHFGVKPEQVTVGNGGDGVIMQLCLAYLHERNEVIVSRSSFPVYDQFAQVMRASLVKVPLRDYRLDLDAMAEAISDKTELVFVCNPNNPTGTIVTASEVAAFMDRVPERVLIVFDEAYRELVDSEDFPDTMAYIKDGRPNVMILRTFSKVYGLAGIRLGYGIAAPEILDRLEPVKEPFAVNRLAQAAGVAALEDRAFLEQTVASNHQGRLYLYGEFDRLNLPYLKSHTNFVLVDVGQQATVIERNLLDMGVRVRPCGGYEFPTHLRVTVGTPEQNRQLIKGLEEVLL